MERNFSAVHFQFEWNAFNLKHFAVSQFSVLFLSRHHLHWLSGTFHRTIRQKFLGENIWCLPCDFNLISNFWNTANIPEKLMLSLLSNRTDDFDMLDHSLYSSRLSFNKMPPIFCFCFGVFFVGGARGKSWFVCLFF